MLVAHSLVTKAKRNVSLHYFVSVCELFCFFFLISVTCQPMCLLVFNKVLFVFSTPAKEIANVTVNYNKCFFLKPLFHINKMCTVKKKGINVVWCICAKKSWTDKRRISETFACNIITICKLTTTNKWIDYYQCHTSYHTPLHHYTIYNGDNNDTYTRLTRLQDATLSNRVRTE